MRIRIRLHAEAQAQVQVQVHTIICMRYTEASKQVSRQASKQAGMSRMHEGVAEVYT